MANKNPLFIGLPPQSTFEMICESRSSIHQRITILYDGKPIDIFVADEYDGPMRLSNGSTEYSRSADELPRFELLFEYSENGPHGPFKKSRVTSDANGGPVLAVATLQTETPGPLKWTMKLYASRQKKWSEILTGLFFGHES